MLPPSVSGSVETTRSAMASNRETRSANRATLASSAPFRGPVEARRRSSIHCRIRAVGLSCSTAACSRTQSNRDFGSRTEVTIIGSESTSVSHVAESMASTRSVVSKWSRRTSDSRSSTCSTSSINRQLFGHPARRAKARRSGSVMSRAVTTYIRPSSESARTTTRYRPAPVVPKIKVVFSRPPATRRGRENTTSSTSPGVTPCRAMWSSLCSVHRISRTAGQRSTSYYVERTSTRRITCAHPSRGEGLTSRPGGRHAASLTAPARSPHELDLDAVRSDPCRASLTSNSRGIVAHVAPCTEQTPHGGHATGP